MKRALAVAGFLLPFLFAAPAQAGAPIDGPIQLRDYIETCWNPPGGGRGEENIVVATVLYIGKDGRVAKLGIDSAHSKGQDHPLWKAFVSSLIRAMESPRCQPLPIAAHELPKVMKLQFSIQDFTRR